MATVIKTKKKKKLTKKQRELKESVKKCQEILKGKDIKPFNREEFYRTAI